MIFTTCSKPPVLSLTGTALNYHGWLVVEAEQDPAIAHPLTYAKLGFYNIQKFAQQAGLKLA